MALPLLFVVPAVVATGAVGAGKTYKSFTDSRKANKMTAEANDHVDAAKISLERSRVLCADSLNNLGQEKLFVLNNEVARFIHIFEKIKNVELTDSLGLEELHKLRVDRESLGELKEMQQFAAAVAGGVSAGVAGGALTAFGAWGAASAFATASTGTAIASLSGAAATNATLAFFGGGALAAGGLGMAGGAVVLGGIIAAPALLVMGLITGKKAEEKLEVARANEAQAAEVCAELSNAAYQCDAIRRRTYMFYTMLARLDARFINEIFLLEKVLETEGDDYSLFSKEAKSVVLRCATMAGSVKAILDTPILSEDGSLTDDSLRLTETIGMSLGSFK